MSSGNARAEKQSGVYTVSNFPPPMPGDASTSDSVSWFATYSKAGPSSPWRIALVTLCSVENWRILS